MATTSSQHHLKDLHSTQTECLLLSLPYDIRYLIYTHLFPPSAQIYIQASTTRPQLTHISPDWQIPTALLRTNRRIHAEASAFLYNSYLFNIVGRKRDCLGAYKGFQATLQRYARHEVCLHAFSNGTHSDTMCVSLQTGTAKMRVLWARRRGVLMEIQQLETEVNESEETGWGRWRSSPGATKSLFIIYALIVTVIAFYFGRSRVHHRDE